MIVKDLVTKAGMAMLSIVVLGCGVSEQNAAKTAPIGLITTPASYYSSAKARYLGAKYKENLDRLAERIVRNPKTAKLQFANNISSVGGIGFFTHSATNASDERFLEVIVSAPDTFENKGDWNAKIVSLFTSYGRELLAILASDPDIFQEKEVSGYGLNFTWRSLVADSKGSRVILERVVIYVPKGNTRGFLQQEIEANSLLAEAIIFTAEDNGPIMLASYRQQDSRTDTRLPIHEESLGFQQTESSKADARSAKKLQPETATDLVVPLPGSGGTRSTRMAADSSPPPSRRQDFEERRREASSAGNPTATSEAGGAGTRSVDERDKSQQAMKRSDYEAMAKKPIGPAVLPSLGVPEVAKSDVRNAAKLPQNSSVTKQVDATVESTKAEARALMAPIPNADASAKTASQVRSLASLGVEKAATGAEISRPIPLNASQPGGTEGKTGLAISPAGTKSAADSETTGLQKSTRAQNSALSEVQSKIEKKIPATPSEPSVSAKTSAAVAGQPQAQIASALPAQRRQSEGIKTELNPAETKTPRGDSEKRATASTGGAFIPEAGKGTSSKSADVTTVKPEAKASAIAPAIVTASASPTEATGISNNSVPERIALKKKQTETLPAAKSVTNAPSRLLEGYIIQLAFTDKADARRWSERMEQRGYVVSVTEAGGTDSVRVRVGNFSVREQADRQLVSFKQEGLSGIVINLPQAYQPGAPNPDKPTIQ